MNWKCLNCKFLKHEPHQSWYVGENYANDESPETLSCERLKFYLRDLTPEEVGHVFEATGDCELFEKKKEKE